MLFLVSVLAYVAVPGIEVIRFQMDGAARGAAAALVSAQRLAVKRQHDVVVSFDTAGGRLRIHQDSDNDGVVDSGERTRWVELDKVRFSRGPAPALDGQGAAVTFEERQDGWPAVSFIRNGSATEEGTFYLTSHRSSRGSGYAKDTRAVRLERATGRVTWYRYAPPTWVEGL
ncbi:MAG: GspH/FimT family pseudopilin [Gemmatimonadota bacterium]